MIYLAYISIIFALSQLLTAVINLIFRQRLKKTQPINNELISILIPARNEENNIGNLIKSLQCADNKKIEILVYDDQSSDNTAKIVSTLANDDPRITLLQSDGLPAGWIGKNHACYSLAKQAKGSFFLFLDADVMIEYEIIDDAVAVCKKKQLGLLSIFPKQILDSLGEKCSVPVMNYILLTLLPLIFVRFSPFKSHSAANGQFMLFSSAEYRLLQPHETFKSSPVEDINISRYYKKKGIKVACLASESRVTCRMYKSYDEALNGFAKNVFMFFGNRPLLAILFWIITTLGFIPVITLTNLILEYLAILFLIRISVSLASRQNSLVNILLLPVHQLFLLHVIIKAIFIKFTKKYSWKGRDIYS